MSVRPDSRHVRSRWMKGGALWLGAAVALGWGCKREEPAPSAPPSLRAPEPLPRLEEPPPAATGGPSADSAREALHRIQKLEPYGRPLPQKAPRLVLTADGIREGDTVLAPESAEGRARLEALAKAGPLLLAPADEEVFLAQVAPALALLDELEAEVAWVHPDAPEASIPFTLKDAKAFGAWLDEATPGRLRVVQRADGFELQTAVGKLPGRDPNGPSVPARGGQMDLALLRQGLELLVGRFQEVEELGFVPSYGTEVVKIARAMGANFAAPDSAIFDSMFLVYPRPGSGSSTP